MPNETIQPTRKALLASRADSCVDWCFALARKMMNDISKIHWHDSVILRVIEVAKDRKLILEVSYPENWASGIYRIYCFEFIRTYKYQVHEAPMIGPVTILDLSLEEEQDEHGATTYRMETNAGYRIIKCTKIDKKCQEYQGGRHAASRSTTFQWTRRDSPVAFPLDLSHRGIEAEHQTSRGRGFRTYQAPYVSSTEGV